MAEKRDAAEGMETKEEILAKMERNCRKYSLNKLRGNKGNVKANGGNIKRNAKSDGM